jgi:hypothetical protein
MNRKTGLRIRNNETPLAFIATNSKLSERFPKVINAATITVRGKAMGTKSAKDSPINLIKTPVGIPFPTNSSMYFHRNCIKKRNKLNTNVTMNGPI